MRKHFLATIALVPVILSGARAAQPHVAEMPQPLEVFGEESGGYLGVDIYDITSDRVAPLKLKEEKGVEVTMVDQDAPAGRAGIKEHDVILSLNGTAVESKSQLHRMIRETPPGRAVTLGLSRDGQPLTVKVLLADRGKEFDRDLTASKGKGNDFHFEFPQINMPDFDVPNIGVVYVRSSTRTGLMVENLTPQLSEFFGAKNGNGVLVRSVEKGGRAEKAGLRAGDLILKVGDRTIHDSEDFTQEMHTQRSGSVKLSVMRDKKEQTITLTLPEQKDSGKSLEGFSTPIFGEKSRLELGELKNEIARMRPEIELAEEEAAEGSAEMQLSSAAMQKALAEQLEKVHEEVSPQVQEEFQKSRQKFQDEVQQLRQQMRGGFFDL